MKTFAKFTFEVFPDAPGETIVKIQAADIDGHPVPLVALTDVWFSDRVEGIGVAREYLDRRATTLDNDRPYVSCRQGTLFAQIVRNAILRIQTDTDGACGIRFRFAGNVRVAAQAAGMVLPSVSRELVREDFGADQPRQHPDDGRLTTPPPRNAPPAARPRLSPVSG